MFIGLFPQKSPIINAPSAETDLQLKASDASSAPSTCMLVCACASIYVCMYVCMYVFMFVCLYVCMFVCMHIRMYVCVCACMSCVCLHMCACV